VIAYESEPFSVVFFKKYADCFFKDVALHLDIPQFSTKHRNLGQMAIAGEGLLAIVTKLPLPAVERIRLDS